MYADGPIAAGPIGASSEGFSDAFDTRGVVLPAITLKAEVLALGGKTKEGEIVLGVRDFWLDMIRMFLRDPRSLYEIGPRQFEEMIAGAQAKTGRYDEVVLTPRSADKGRDIIMTKWGYGSLRIANEVKAYKPGRVVTAQEVRAFITVVSENPFSKGIITTTAAFAPKLMDNDDIKRQVPYKVELMARDELLSWLEELVHR